MHAHQPNFREVVVLEPQGSCELRDALKNRTVSFGATRELRVEPPLEPLVHINLRIQAVPHSNDLYSLRLEARNPRHEQQGYDLTDVPLQLVRITSEDVEPEPLIESSDGAVLYFRGLKKDTNYLLTVSDGGGIHPEVDPRDPSWSADLRHPNVLQAEAKAEPSAGDREHAIAV